MLFDSYIVCLYVFLLGTRSMKKESNHLISNSGIVDFTIHLDLYLDLVYLSIRLDSRVLWGYLSIGRRLIILSLNLWKRDLLISYHHRARGLFLPLLSPFKHSTLFTCIHMCLLTVQSLVSLICPKVSHLKSLYCFVRKLVIQAKPISRYVN